MKKVPYASAVGSSMYGMVCTRPDIGYVFGVVSRYMSNPGREHWVTMKWIFRYLKGTSSVCLRFGSCKHLLEGYTDSDMSIDVDTSRSTSRYVMTNAGGLFRGSRGCRRLWRCRPRKPSIWPQQSRQGHNMDEGVHRRVGNSARGILTPL